MMEHYTRYIDIPQISQARYAVDVPLDYMEDWIENQMKVGLNLEPDFQRAHVWADDQRSRYVEYILRGGNSGRDIYFNHPGWRRDFIGEMVIVDGKQRLQAIRMFMDNKIRAFGSLHSEFTDCQRIFSITLKFHVNDLKNREDVLRWYIDFNAGGTPHTDEEIEKVRLMLNKELMR